MEAAVDEVVSDVTWDVPLRLLGGLHYVALRDGVDPWTDVHDVVRAHADFLARFVAEQGVQTNEVQRAWALLPAFLSLDRPLDLVELGPSGGLNLVWDRYRYRYAAGSWGPSDSPLELAGEERLPVAERLLGRSADVRRRRGVVFKTASTSYLSRDRYGELWHVLGAAEPPLAWISTRRHTELETDIEEGHELELAVMPRQRPRLVARLGFHAQWVEWLG